jgi:hypothetical protein
MTCEIELARMRLIVPPLAAHHPLAHVAFGMFKR